MKAENTVRWHMTTLRAIVKSPVCSDEARDMAEYTLGVLQWVLKNGPKEPRWQVFDFVERRQPRKEPHAQ